MSLQLRRTAVSRENVRVKPETGKVGGLARPALRPLINCNVAAKPVTRLAVKAKTTITTTETVKTIKKTAVTEKTTNTVQACSVVKNTKVISKPSFAVKAVDAKRTLVEPSRLLKKVEPKAVKVVVPKALPLESQSSQLHDIEDIDKDDALSPLLAPPYANDIYAYLRELERKYPVRPAYLSGQSINGSMRALLLNWLVEVHDEFKMIQESLHLTVGILDRFLQDYRKIDRTKLQLVGATCLFIAGKYEELFGPDVCDLVYTTQGACTKEEIFEMECKILSTLDFNLGKPLPLHFLRRYTKAAKAEAVHHNMAKYLVELGLLDYSLCHHPPSLLAAAALYLSLWIFSGEKTLTEKLWTDTLSFYSTYSFSSISHLVKNLAALVVKAETSKYKAVRSKFSASKYLKVSLNEALSSSHLKKLAMW
ncbi:G2/mitotic-specific cyclin-B2 [Ischnura elegans]|uniref:G2/mitotic-specific cyclin-B2 n=1 Tax=Ischnura elegans TaxID=197161 RepID=UPI001ED8ABCD|nr:G2/mitotic-specific cyclin-B2 [Ischnura elegans]